MRRLLSALVPLVLASSALAEPAITHTTPSALIPLLRGAGYSAKLDKSGRNPRLDFTTQGYEVELEFVGCVNTSCRSVYASYGFDLKHGYSQDKANLWNRRNFTVVYLDKDSDPFVQSAYVLAGGVTKTNFLTWLKDYLDDLQDFGDSLPDDDSDPPST